MAAMLEVANAEAEVGRARIVYETAGTAF